MPRLTDKALALMVSLFNKPLQCYFHSFLPDGIKETDNSVSREMRTTSVVQHCLSRIWHLLRTTPHCEGLTAEIDPKNEQTKVHRTRSVWIKKGALKVHNRAWVLQSAGRRAMAIQFLLNSIVK